MNNLPEVSLATLIKRMNLTVPRLLAFWRHTANHNLLAFKCKVGFLNNRYEHNNHNPRNKAARQKTINDNHASYANTIRNKLFYEDCNAKADELCSLPPRKTVRI